MEEVGGRNDNQEAANASIPNDWDQPFTEQELEAIDAAFRVASSSTKRSHGEPVHGSAEPQHRRKLPPSLACSLGHTPTSFSLSPCPRNRSLIAPSPLSRAMQKFQRPVLSFGGQIVYSRRASEVAKATREILHMVDAKRRETGQAVLGFDIEWRPSFRKGISPGKVAVMQICGDTSRCYVMHIFHSGIPQILQSLLEDPTSIKVGVNIAGDSVKLFKDYDVSVKALEDLSGLANQKFGGDRRNWSLASLVDVLISKELAKPRKIKLGNWEVKGLSKAQLQYAAIDAYASWYLYEVLKDLPDAAIDGTVDGNPSD